MSATSFAHTHDREACADCARQRARWGPTDHCGRTCELQIGDLVTIRGGRVVWQVETVNGAHVTVSSTTPQKIGARRTPWKTFGPGLAQDVVNALIPLPQDKVDLFNWLKAERQHQFELRVQARRDDMALRARPLDITVERAEYDELATALVTAAKSLLAADGKSDLLKRLHLARKAFQDLETVVVNRASDQPV